jgi:hypothetical protein
MTGRLHQKACFAGGGAPDPRNVGDVSCGSNVGGSTNVVREMSEVASGASMAGGGGGGAELRADGTAGVAVTERGVDRTGVEDELRPVSRAIGATAGVGAGVGTDAGATSGGGG